MIEQSALNLIMEVSPEQEQPLRSLLALLHDTPATAPWATRTAPAS